MRNRLLPALLALLFLLPGCESDPRIAKAPGSHRKIFYEYFNDIRLQIAELEKTHVQLENFTRDTRAFLESREAQSRYEVCGLYFERGKDRSRGAYNLADRFFTGGCQIHLIFYTENEFERFEAVKNKDKAKGVEIDGYLFYYQVFTANPASEGLEKELAGIIENTLQKYRGRFPSPDTFW